MMFPIVWKMLLHRKARFIFTVFGLSTLFLLSAAQVGLLVGWCNTITAITAHAGVDVWVMNKLTLAWDYGTSLPRHRIDQVRSVPGVAWSEGMYVGWSMWQRPDGRRLSVQVVGLDRSTVGGPWAMVEGRVEDVLRPDSVIIDELFLDTLGVQRVGEEVEMYGKKAVVRGISREVRTFTATPFVFTSLNTAAHYDKAFNDEDTTFVLVRCVPGTNPNEVARHIAEEVPGVEALTTDELMRRSLSYWMAETGIGLIMITTASLGIVVSSVVTSLTLYTITQDHLANYATLLAVGFSRAQLLGGILTQGLILNGLGVLLGSLAFCGLSLVSARTPAPLEMMPLVFGALVAVSAGSCVLGALLSVKVVLRLDPVSVFRG
jgi:putative ABC transport system permease protein